MPYKDKYRILCNMESSLPIFSRDWWLDTVCGNDKWDVLLVEEKGRILATMPLYVPVSGMVSMPPYTQTMGPWFALDSPDTKYTTVLGRRQALSKALIEGLKEYDVFLQNFNYFITDWLPYYWEGFKQTTRYTYLLENISNTDALWDNMSINIRRNITKAKEKAFISVKRSIPIEEFLQIYSLTFERQHERAPSLDILKKLINICRERKQGDLWGGYDQEGRLHAVAFIVWQDSCAYYLAGGGDPSLRSSGAHSLVMWEGIQAVSRYTDTFDFEGSMIPGVERFFREFGARQTPFFTISKGEKSLLQKVRMKMGL